MRKRPTIVNSFFIMLVTLSLVNTIYTSEVGATTVESEDVKSRFREVALILYQQDIFTAEDEEECVMRGSDSVLALRYLMYCNAKLQLMGSQAKEEYEKNWYNHLNELEEMRGEFERADVDRARLKRLFYNRSDLVLATGMK